MGRAATAPPFGGTTPPTIPHSSSIRSPRMPQVSAKTSVESRPGEFGPTLSIICSAMVGLLQFSASIGFVMPPGGRRHSSPVDTPLTTGVTMLFQSVTGRVPPVTAFIKAVTARRLWIREKSRGLGSTCAEDHGNPPRMVSAGIAICRTNRRRGGHWPVPRALTWNVPLP